MVDDGKKKFEVVEVKGTEIKCKILLGGNTKGRRSLNLPGAKLKIGALTDKDKKDIAFGLKNKVDIIAFSFVRKPDDVRELRDILNKAGSTAKIMAKIETVEAIECFDEILELVDMVMVARGDLAVELGYENVPPAQKMMIEKCNQAGKPVVTATQMLESMIKSPFPTRAEVSDVANAIYDGTDAVMLSEETTLGDFPIEAVSMLTKIAERVESDERYIELRNGGVMADGTLDTLAESAVHMADSALVEPQAIIALTETGEIARYMAALKPTVPVVVASSSVPTLGQVWVSYGCYPVAIKKGKDAEVKAKEAIASLVKAKALSKGQYVVVVSEDDMTVRMVQI
jgi:pyruvate kinase